MKLRIVSLILAHVLGLLLSCKVPTTEAKRTLPISEAQRELTEAELTGRFNKILDEKLADEGICLTLPAMRKLEDLMRKGAAEIISNKDFGRVPEAEQNIRKFADKLRELVVTTSDPYSRRAIKITLKHVNMSLMKRSKVVSGRGLCPLFPICK